MHHIRFAAVLAGLSLAARPCAAAPSPRAGAAKALLATYEEFCLNRFPNLDSVKRLMAEQKLPAATKAQREQAMLGGAGDSWAIDTPTGTFIVAMAPPPHIGCAVGGNAQDDAAGRAVFDAMVSLFASNHDLGALVRPPLKTGTYANRPATQQTIAALPQGGPRQAFLNLALTNPDGTTQVRLTREVEK